MHHIDLPLNMYGIYQLTFFFSAISADFSARAFSWLLRFFRRVSGTKMWSLVGTDL